MGLAGSKRRNKLSQDPNNTSWSKSTDGFGHKILTAQGWQPGQLLGATDAKQAAHFTAANASHIRVVLREDNLGLGAQLGGSNVETFGLSTLSGIFGRLNGKSDVEVQKQQSAQRDVGLRSYQAKKYGTMNFVSGGILLGDKVEDINSNERLASDSFNQEASPAKSSKKSKKRQHPQPDSTVTLDNEASAKALLKAEKRERKEARRKRREARKVVSCDAVAPTIATESDSGPASNTAPASFAGSRHNVRQRYIQQKRMASMDARALNEILMTKMPIC